MYNAFYKHFDRKICFLCFYADNKTLSFLSTRCQFMLMKRIISDNNYVENGEYTRGFYLFVCLRFFSFFFSKSRAKMKTLHDRFVEMLIHRIFIRKCSSEKKNTTLKFKRFLFNTFIFRWNFA